MVQFKVQGWGRTRPLVWFSVWSQQHFENPFRTGPNPNQTAWSACQPPSKITVLVPLLLIIVPTYCLMLCFMLVTIIAFLVAFGLTPLFHTYPLCSTASSLIPQLPLLFYMIILAGFNGTTWWLW